MLKDFLYLELCVHMEEVQFLDSPRHSTSRCVIAHKLVFGSYLLDTCGCDRCISGLYTAGRGSSSLL